MPFLFHIVKLLALFALVSILVVNQSATSADVDSVLSTRDGWQTIADDPFRLQLPAEMQERHNIPDHSGYVRVFTGKRILLFTINYAAGSCEIPRATSNRPGVEQSIINVRSREAILTIGPSVNRGHLFAGICFANVDNQGKHLRLKALFVDREALNLAKEIFDTVEIHNY